MVLVTRARARKKVIKWDVIASKGENRVIANGSN